MFIVHWWHHTSTLPLRTLFSLNLLQLVLATCLGILSLLWVNYDPLVGVSPKLKSVYPTETYEVFMGISTGAFIALVFVPFFGLFGILKGIKPVTGIYVVLALLAGMGLAVSSYYQRITITSTESSCDECYQCDPGNVIACEAPAKTENKKCLISTDVCVGLLIQARVVFGILIGAAFILMLSSIVAVAALAKKQEQEYRQVSDKESDG